MGGSNSQPESLQKKTTMTSESTTTLELPLPRNDMRRLAIEQSAVIGSLYNARQDRFLKISPLKIPSISRQSDEIPECAVIHGDVLQDKSLLDLIDGDKDFWLSVRLDMAPANGIPSIINYSLTTNVLTRIFFYSYLSAEKNIAKEQNIIQSNIPESIRNVTVTHVVTGIRSGIAVVVVLQLLSDDESNLNIVLKKLQKEMIQNSFNLSEDDKRLLGRFSSTQVFSNISDIAKLTKLTDVCQKIVKIKSQTSIHRLLDYTLTPIRCFYPNHPAENASFSPLNLKTRTVIKQQWYKLTLVKKPWEIQIDFAQKQLLEDHLKQKFVEVQQQVLKAREMYKIEIERLHNTVSELRSGNLHQNSSIETLIDGQFEELLAETNNVSEQLNKLIKKVQFIDGCKNERIEYWNVKKLVQGNDHDLGTIAKQLLLKNNQKRIFCFDDRLAQQYSSQWKNFYAMLIRECRNNRQLKYVYADFSYCSYQLPRMKILSSKDIPEQRKSPPPSKTIPLSPETAKSDQTNPTTTNIINILLLGEHGVGKSTFINAIINYLTFEDFTEARSDQPIVLIPVSFLMIDKDHLEERTITLGEEDSNEDHDHPDQLTTQYCRSYIFTINTQTKIRLIDTPGMGDVRGSDQDDLNMKNILVFISNLSHLNAICILFKPNDARLDIVFRSYFTRLLGFLGEHVRNNIIICFTNTRGTFFAPGDTASLLKRMLKSYSMKDIPFNKLNVFCFDNEPFRYLVARLNGIKFDDYQKGEYERSWGISVDESNRFLEYVCSELPAFPQQDWQSTEHAQFQIIQMIRPILETTRNTMRNIILRKERPSKLPIKLFPEILSCPSAICTACTCTTQYCSNFWILPDKPHTSASKCHDCKCSRKAHINIDYKLTYRNSNDSNLESYDELKSTLNHLKTVILKFASFFTYIAPHSEAGDPILIALTQMIIEENQLFTLKRTKFFNLMLYNELNQLKQEYEQQRIDTILDKNPIDLLDIYELIKNINEIDSIREQLDCIKQFHRNSMGQQETIVS